MVCTYGFKLFEAVMLRRRRGEGEKGSAIGGGSGGGVGDVEKAAPPASLPPTSKSAPRCEDDSARATASLSKWSSKKRGEPGFGKGGGKGQGRQKRDSTGKKNDSFDSAAGCLDGGGDLPPAT